MSAYRGQAAGSRAALGAAAAGASALAAMVALVVVGALGGVGWSTSTTGPDEGETVAPSPLALRDIPPLYLRLYEQAAARYGVRWTVLAGIGKVECDHGRDPSPACSVEGAVNAAGAAADAVPGLHLGDLRRRRGRRGTS